MHADMLPGAVERRDIDRIVADAAPLEQLPTFGLVDDVLDGRRSTIREPAVAC